MAEIWLHFFHVPPVQFVSAFFIELHSEFFLLSLYEIWQDYQIFVTEYNAFLK